MRSRGAVDDRDALQYHRPIAWTRPIVNPRRWRHPMSKGITRRQMLAQVGIAAAAVHTLDPHELCCATPAYAQTTSAGKDLFELKKVADGVYAAVAAPAYKVNSNAAVIVTNDGVVVVDSHSKPSAARAVYQQI